MNILHAAKIVLLPLVFMLPLATAVGGELSAVINGKSIHVDASKEWNDENYGLGLEYQFATKSRWKKVLMANGFRDSNDDMSYMAGAGLHRNLFATDRLNGFHLDAGINAFLMTREDVNDNKPFLGALPSLTVGNRYGGVNLTYLPKKAVEKMYDAKMDDDTISGIVFLQFKVHFGQLLADK